MRGEGSNFDALAAQVRKLSQAVARLTKDVPPLAEVEADQPATAISDQQLLKAAQRIVRQRKRRYPFFSRDLISDPAWDMLLDLTIAKLAGSRVSISSLCIASEAAPSTALRWIGKMQGEGHFIRVPDEHDRRRTYIELHPDTERAMRTLLTEEYQAGEGR